MRGAARTLVGAAALLVMAAGIGACGEGKADAAERAPSSASVSPATALTTLTVRSARDVARDAARDAARALDASAADAENARTATTPRRTASVRGTVSLLGAIPPDTLVAATHDTPPCAAYPDAPWQLGGADGRALGQAVVWLVPADTSLVLPADTAARRATLALADCRIQPRVSRVALGATLMLRGRDAMDARLRFVDVVGDASPDSATRAAAIRALIPLQDADVIVPVTQVTTAPGLVEIRDDRHPWVKGWLVVAPHRWVTVTDIDGGFVFDDVPEGEWTVIVWHERVGVRVQQVPVTAGVTAVLGVGVEVGGGR